ncbi:MAG: hypothetical protein J6P16_03915 [Eubacterium sp.]|nr:hypothetical protein [Eubacterium sp.]
MYKVSLKKRLIAGLMVLVMAFMVPSVHVQGASKEKVYIKSFHALNVKGIYFDFEAKAFCDSVTGWTSLPDTLNKGGFSQFKSGNNVFLCYETTTDRSEAVTDVALMNEKGNYSEGSYKRILEEQKKTYTDMVNNLKTLLEEYRKNVKNNVTTALQSKKFMNGYIDPDSKKRLGDLLMDVSDEDLTKILLQANGNVVMMVQEQLAYASDTGNRTWLDRMVQLGSKGDAYQFLFDQAKKSFNGDEQRATAALDEKYKTDAVLLQDKYKGIGGHVKAIKEFSEKNGLDKMSGDEKNTWLKNNASDPATALYIAENAAVTALASYKYEDKTLLDFFMQDESVFNGTGIRKLYPLAASLTDGQRAALDESTDILTLVNAAIRSTAQDDLTKGKATEITADEKKEIGKISDEYDKTVTAMEDSASPMSIYDGVDRDLFKDDGGVAVTSDAEKYKTDEGKTWVDAFIDEYSYQKLALVTGAGAVGCAVLAGSFAWAAGRIREAAIETGYNLVDSNVGKVPVSGETIDATKDYLLEDIKKMATGKTQAQISQAKQAGLKNALNEYYEVGMYNSTRWTKVKMGIYTGLKWGMAVASILLFAADIALTAYQLYKYYNVEHLPVPHHMVDITYDNTKQTGFITYKGVTDQDKKTVDALGGSGVQWLAMYETHDERAGEPILAPENGKGYEILIQYGDSKPKNGYSPLHMFGSPNTPQNITYADGRSGFSYNDDKNGVYVFFRRDTDTSVEDEQTTSQKNAGSAGTSDDGKKAKEAAAVSGSVADTSEAGTAVNDGNIYIVVTIGVVAVIFVGGVMVIRSRRRKNGTK